MSINKVAESLSAAKSVLIIGHKRGDSDSYGSSFAMSQILVEMGKETYIYSNEKFPDNLRFLFSYFEGGIGIDVPDVIDTILVLDCSDLSRTPDPELVKNLKEKGALVCYLDHHTSGDLRQFADEGFDDENACSTSELVFRISSLLETGLTKNSATCLLAGIIGDTSSFQNQNTTRECLEISAKLMKLGARYKTIIDHTFGGKEVDTLRLWGLAMERLISDKQTGAVVSYLTYDDICENGSSPEAVSGIVNFINQIKGAKFVVFITEEVRGTINISFRTRDKDIDLARLAKQIGGGGHVKAAGASFPGSLVIKDGIPRII